MTLLKMTDIDLSNKRVLIREDLNVPIENNHITNDARILAALPTIEYALQHNAKVIIMSHLGRPKEGYYEEAYSLAPVAKRLEHYLKKNVGLIKDVFDHSLNSEAGDIVLLENVRFNKGEKENDPTLAKKMASLCDVFVMDAFATAHRKEASTYGVAEFAKVACAGPLLISELAALKSVMENPKHPLIAVVGGSKVSTKLTVLKSLLTKVDQLIIGGGIANTFLAATGKSIGQSLYESELLNEAKQLLSNYNKKIPLPTDVVVAKKFEKNAKASTKSIDDIDHDEMILDIGPVTSEQYAHFIKKANTVLWNGPVGVFEWDQFSHGTKTIAQAIANSSAYSVAGGGDTLAAIDKYKISDKLSYISTGGGAFLEFIEGKKLPAIEILEQRSHKGK